MLAVPLEAGVGDEHRLDEGPRVGVERPLVERVSRQELHDLSEVHDRDPRAQLKRGREVVGDEEVGTPELSLQVVQERHHLGLQGDVQRAERLVEDDERRIRDERSGDAGALLLPARELMRKAILQPGLEADALEHLPVRLRSESCCRCSRSGARPRCPRCAAAGRASSPGSGRPSAARPAGVCGHRLRARLPREEESSRRSAHRARREPVPASTSRSRIRRRARTSRPGSDRTSRRPRRIPWCASSAPVRAPRRNAS